MSAPNSRRHVTSGPTGLSFMRSLPVSVQLPARAASNAVRKRISVPACPMSSATGPLLGWLCLIISSERASTVVSSELERFWIWVSALRTSFNSNKRLLMDFDPGRVTDARILPVPDSRRSITEREVEPDCFFDLGRFYWYVPLCAAWLGNECEPHQAFFV